MSIGVAELIITSCGCGVLLGLLVVGIVAVWAFITLRRPKNASS